jgi:endonuclease III
MTPSGFANRVVELFEKRESVFENKVNVEDWVPQEFNDLEKSCFLFYVTQLDYAIKSQLLYEGAIKLIKINPEFFLPKTILDLTDEELTDFLKTYLRPRYINEAVFRYKANSQKLMDLYNGNPKEIFNDEDATKVLKKILDFRGFGPKTGNLFFRSMVTTFEINYSNIDKILQPVDMHDVRIAKYMGYVDSDEMTEKNVKRVKELWNKACLTANVNWLTFDKALWLLGSVGQPKNKEDILKLLLL